MDLPFFGASAGSCGCVHAGDPPTSDSGTPTITIDNDTLWWYGLDGHRYYVIGTQLDPAGDGILLESGDFLLQEDGFKILQEA